MVSLANTHSVGKTTLANLISHLYHTKISVTCFDATLPGSLSLRRQSDAVENINSIYKLERILVNNLNDLDDLRKLAEDRNVNIFDVSGGNQFEYYDILRFSNLVVIPIYYSEECYLQTMGFLGFLYNMVEFKGNILFVPNAINDNEKEYPYKSVFVESIKKYGLVANEVPKKNSLANIYTHTIPDNLLKLCEHLMLPINKFLNLNL